MGGANERAARTEWQLHDGHEGVNLLEWACALPAVAGHRFGSVVDAPAGRVGSGAEQPFQLRKTRKARMGERRFQPSTCNDQLVQPFSTTNSANHTKEEGRFTTEFTEGGMTTREEGAEENANGLHVLRPTWVLPPSLPLFSLSSLW